MSSLASVSDHHHHHPQRSTLPLGSSSSRSSVISSLPRSKAINHNRQRSVHRNKYNEQVCSTLREAGLPRKEFKQCMKQGLEMESMRNGSLLAVRECQAQFRTRRWNCSVVNDRSIIGNNALNRGRWIYLI